MGLKITASDIKRLSLCADYLWTTSWCLSLCFCKGATHSLHQVGTIFYFDILEFALASCFLIKNVKIFTLTYKMIYLENPCMQPSHNHKSSLLLFFVITCSVRILQPTVEWEIFKVLDLKWICQHIFC